MNRIGRAESFVSSPETPTSATLAGSTRAFSRSALIVSPILGSALVEPALEDAICDLVTQDFKGAPGDHPAASPAQTVLHQIVLGEARSAHYLQCFIRRKETGLVAGKLGKGGVLRRRQSILGVDGGAHQHHLRRSELEFHICEFPLQPLKLANGTTKLISLKRMITRGVEGVSAECYRTRGISETLDVEAGNLLFEPAWAQQDVFLRDAAVIEIELGPLLSVHELGWRPYLEALRFTVDQNGSDAAQPRTEAHIDKKQIGLMAVGAENLRAIDDDVITINPRTGLQLGDSRTGPRLAHAQRNYSFALEQSRQIALLLLG